MKDNEDKNKIESEILKLRIEGKRLDHKLKIASGEGKNKVKDYSNDEHKK